MNNVAFVGWVEINPTYGKPNLLVPAQPNLQIKKAVGVHQRLNVHWRLVRVQACSLGCMGLTLCSVIKWFI